MEIDMADETDRILNELLAKLKAAEERRKNERKTREKPRLVQFGLREHEAEAWLDQEPNYNKWIFKSRHDKETESHRRSSEEHPLIGAAASYQAAIGPYPSCR